MNSLSYIAISVGALLAVILPTRTFAADPVRGASSPPNIVIFYVDDMGYADIGCFGSKVPTPNIDRLAREGVRFTDYYSAQPVCSASRASLMTGCYPTRVGVRGAWGPGAKTGISEKELMLPQMLKKSGYATSMIGKWHLGTAPQFLPTSKGFDEFFGIPYSGDMWPYHPETKEFPKLPLYENAKIIDDDVDPSDQATLAGRYAERAVAFIEQNKGRPFFLYHANNMPHVPLFAGAAFKGKSGAGLYGDVVMEIDWGVGQVYAALEKAGILDQTLIIFTSDNGPWLRYGNHNGSALPLREGKGTVFEGGIRMPFVARYPKLIPAGSVQHEPAMSIDLLPTIAALTGAAGPTLPIDGKDIRPLLACEKGAKSQHESFWFYYGNDQLQGVRMGKWKLLLPHTATQVVEGHEVGKDGKPSPSFAMKVPLSLYDLEADVGERHDLSAEQPAVVEQVMKEVEKARADLGDALTKTNGANRRSLGKAE